MEEETKSKANVVQSLVSERQRLHTSPFKADFWLFSKAMNSKMRDFWSFFALYLLQNTVNRTRPKSFRVTVLTDMRKDY